MWIDNKRYVDASTLVHCYKQEGPYLVNNEQAEKLGSTLRARREELGPLHTAAPTRLKFDSPTVHPDRAGQVFASPRTDSSPKIASVLGLNLADL